MRRASSRLSLIRRLSAMLLAIATLAMSPGMSAAQTETVGGVGGSAFSLPCPQDAPYMLGVAVRAGGIVDAIRANCMGWDGAARQYRSPPKFTEFSGGAGGSLQQNGCSADRYVSGIRVGFSRVRNRLLYLDYIELKCSVISGYGGDVSVCLSTGDGCWSGAGEFARSCPSGQAAIGLQGRSGAFVNALGLLCGPKPRPIQISAPPRPQPVPGGTASSDPCAAAPADMRDMCLAHNEKRKLHCVGSLKWSPDLQAKAETWAQKCTNTHSGSGGENLAFFFPSGTNLKAFTDSWYCEVKWYDFKNPKVVGGFKKGCDPPVNGHFTQVVWKDSTELGCAKSTCTVNGSTGTYFVCRYNPAGNFNADNQANLRQQVLAPTCK